MLDSVHENYVPHRDRLIFGNEVMDDCFRKSGIVHDIPYTVYPILPMISNHSPIIWEVEFFEGWKPLSPLQLAVEEVMLE
ncbi:hypothetical protein Tco_1021029 [Tanacetum coccineum]